MIISNSTIGAASRIATSRLQAELVRAQNELSSGRRQDVGLDLGAKSVAASIIRAQIAEGDAYADGSKVSVAKLGATGTALNAMISVGQDFQQKLLTEGVGGSPRTLVDVAKTALGQIVSIANATFQSGYMFAGLNDGSAPLKAFGEPVGSSPTGAISDAFLAAFGKPPGDITNNSISADGMKAFLETEFSALFLDAGWKSTWSTASDQTQEFRTSRHQLLGSHLTANEQGVRDLVRSLAAVAGLGFETLNSDARGVVVDAASKSVGNALSGLASLNARVGIASNAAQNDLDEIETRKVGLQSRLSDMESVDPAEVSVRISTLSTMLQASYQTTAKLAQLSLLNFI